MPPFAAFKFLRLRQLINPSLFFLGVDRVNFFCDPAREVRVLVFQVFHHLLNKYNIWVRVLNSSFESELDTTLFFQDIMIVLHEKDMSTSSFFIFDSTL